MIDKMTVRFMLLFAVLLAGCTNKQMYDSVQDYAMVRCNKAPGADRAACRQRSQLDYDAYSKQRAALMHGPASEK